MGIVFDTRVERNYKSESRCRRQISHQISLKTVTHPREPINHRRSLKNLTRSNIQFLKKLGLKIREVGRKGK